MCVCPWKAASEVCIVKHTAMIQPIRVGTGKTFALTATSKIAIRIQVTGFVCSRKNRKKSITHTHARSRNYRMETKQMRFALRISFVSVHRNRIHVHDVMIYQRDFQKFAAS